jgi:hypothetical protein
LERAGAGSSSSFLKLRTTKMLAVTYLGASSPSQSS